MLAALIIVFQEVFRSRPDRWNRSGGAAIEGRSGNGLPTEGGFHNAASRVQPSIRGRVDAVFEKGEADSSKDALNLLAMAAGRFRSRLSPCIR